MKEFFKNWGVFLIAVALLVVLRLFVVVTVSVKGHSMDPTLADGQKLVTFQLSSIDRFDIITTQEPDELDKIAVKRVIGIPGDKVEMKDDVLSINGEVVDEPYLKEFKEAFAKDKLQTEYKYNQSFQAVADRALTFTNDFSYEVPEGKYFVLGDNRLISKDSRIFGFVDESMIKGEVFVRYWPLKDIEWLN
ncbi:signal peptidase I [Candidatus Enterococcus willemsii]|uniref:Signal peptidase I n=1 Tax=Candidatus Enterococcus willemsii TaxID=1857215 RepID=A0ABQ6Z0M7_9ENTE|nr:signal peptidase I [Enterococcus sp. CU12B]KAF1304561.1 signal peptidase I [Enterococcus sp. CU12B]